MSKMMRNYLIGLSIAIVIYAPVVSWLTIRKIIVPPELIDTMILFILASATIFYALRTSDIAEATKEQAEATRDQADASVKMAEEMKDTRYDAVRPIIDIQHAKDGERQLGEISVNTETIVSAGLTCVLHNIGIGPAINVYSFSQLFSGERYRYDFGSLGIGGKSELKALSIDVESNRNCLLAYYKDVYGRKFESSRRVQDREETARAAGGTKWELGPLQIRLVEERTNHD